jgi:hypothetical protein
VPRIYGVNRINLTDRQLEAVLGRIDALTDEVRKLNTRLDANEGTLRIARELTQLNESLQALAYAALGQQGPNVRRRRQTGG